MATPREQLADMLRQSRIDAGYGSHGALARKLNVSRPVITKAENTAHPVPSDAILAAWAGATGAPLDTLIALAQREVGHPRLVHALPPGAKPRPASRAAGPPCWCRACFECELYAGGPLGRALYRRTTGRLVSARLERQSVIGRAYLTVIIDEHVLHRLIGSAAIMAEQCGHLATIAGRPDIGLHVIPEGTNVGLWSAFDITRARSVGLA